MIDGEHKHPAMPFSRRTSLLGRYPSLGAKGAVHRSLGSVFRSRVPLVVLGDSSMARIYHALTCAAVKEGSNAPRDYFNLHLASGMSRATSRLAQLQNSSTGGIVLASLGLHYNNDEFMPAAMRLGAVRVRSWLPLKGRAELSKDLEHLGSVLERFAHGCRQCIVIYLTAGMQHFASLAPLDGAFDPNLVLNETHPRNFNFSAYGFGCEKTPSELPSTSSPNHWRAELAVQTMIPRGGPRFTVAPLHLLTAAWGDVHTGMTPQAFRPSGPSHVVNAVPDCTHYCFGPFLYEPVWWTMHTLWKRVTNQTHDEA